MLDEPVPADERYASSDELRDAARILAALRSVPRVVRTDRDGTIRLSVTGGRMTLSTHA